MFCNLILWVFFSVGMGRVQSFCHPSSLTPQRDLVYLRVGPVDPYFFTSDGLRHVKPYLHTFVSNAKQRWVGRSLVDVFTSEFVYGTRDYYDMAIQSGLITVNDAVVSPGRLVTASDVIKHVVHRHETPVHGALPGEIEVVAETEDLLVVSKPSTLPVHPAGAYSHNSLLNILQSERGTQTTSTSSTPRSAIAEKRLYTVHRLDRLTSGLTIFAKNSEIARRFSEDLQAGATTKTYLARVVGDFGSGLAASPLASGWQRETIFLNRNPRALGWSISMISADQDTAIGKSEMFSPNLSDSEAALVVQEESAWVRIQQPIACVTRMDGGYECPFINTNTNASRPLFIPETSLAEKRKGGKEPIKKKGSINDLKIAATFVRKVSFDGATSIVEVTPLHGRTHQIRLHLQALGHPIANDPFYSGYEEDGEEKDNDGESHLALVSNSVLPIINRNEKEKEDKQKDQDGGNANKEDSELEIRQRLQGETTEEFVVRVCRFCRYGRLLPLDKSLRKGKTFTRRNNADTPTIKARGPKNTENLNHSGYDDSSAEVIDSGIWLHALRYTRRRADSPEHDWSFATSLPSWAQDGQKEGAAT